MAAIRKRPGPRGKTVYQAQIIRQGFPSQYRTFDTKGEAEAWARHVEGEMDTGAWRDRSEGDRTTLAEALDRYVQEITPFKAPSTAHREPWILGHLRDGLGRIALSRIEGKDVAGYIRARERRGAKAGTILGELSALGHLYTVARTAWGMSYLVNPVPLAGAARPKTPKGRERRLVGDEEARLLATAPVELAPVIRFALATAMRRGRSRGSAGSTWI